jgi:hypothetical protein
MTDTDFVYFYAKLYNQTNVKTVLMRENWDNNDFDVKYARYMQEYIQLKNTFTAKGYDNEKIKASLEGLRRRRLNSIYDYLFKDMVKRLTQRKGALSDKKIASFTNRLNQFRALTDANLDYLYELRKIEEEEY